MVVYVTLLRHVACQKLLNSANVSWSYSQNNTGTVFFETRCVHRPIQDVSDAGRGYPLLRDTLSHASSSGYMHAYNSFKTLGYTAHCRPSSSSLFGMHHVSA